MPTRWPLLTNTDLGPLFEAASVVLLSAGMFSGAVATWAWLRGANAQEIGEAATLGGVYGFTLGIPLAIGLVFVFQVQI